MFLFILITTLLIGGFVFLLVSSNTKEIAENWPKYRCSPTVIPFAGLYGYDAAENFNYCTKAIFEGQAEALLGPFGAVLTTFVGTLSVLIQSANSMRVQLATLVGGVTKITKEFQDRITQVMFRTQITASRMKMLMGRLFGTFYAVIFMGLSGITAVTNFGDTFLFKFLDTFCFPPETLVEIEGKDTPIPISSVKIGDRFKTTGKDITAVFSFFSDGQPMVQFPNGLQVSTNHYMKYNSQWIQARNHPDASPVGHWAGGYARPLICLNTSDHILPIGGYTFLDYDEVDEGDTETMAWVEKTVNGGSVFTSKKNLEYSPSVSAGTRIRINAGEAVEAGKVRLGDAISTGIIRGIVKKKVSRVCEIGKNEWVSEGTLTWCHEKAMWVRAAELYPVHTLAEDDTFYNFVVTPTAQIELASRVQIRDYVEVHSPESEQFYAKKLAEVSSNATSER
jgi:hypothetical protein